MKTHVRMWVLLVCAFLAGPAQADVLQLIDGRRLEGKVVSRNAKQVVFQVYVSGSPMMTMTFETAEIQQITEGPIQAASKPSSKPTSKPLVDLPPEPPVPAVVTYDGPTYYLIPLRGRVGKVATAAVLEKCLADAARRKPTVVILEVNSPGGSVGEVEKIVDAVRRHGKQMRIVVYVQKKALSAAAIFSLGAKEIYMNPAAILGAATAYQIDEEGMPADVAEKMQSVWRAQARSSAELGGHSTLLAEAMIDNRLELHTVEEGGRKVVKEGQGKNVVVRKGRLLTLTAGEAMACGLSAGTAEDYAELGKALGLPTWTECKGYGTLLAAHWEATVKAVDAALKKLRDDFEDNMRQAGENDPTTFTYTVYRETGKFTPQSKRKWQERSAACARFLVRAENNMKDVAKVAEQYPHLMTDPELLLRWEKGLEVVRKRIQSGTYKTSIGNQ